MNVLLTGATGFVGSHMLRGLLAQGHDVTALARKRDALAERAHLRVQPGDVVSGAGLDAAVAGCDAVIHLVGIILEVGTATFERVHFDGTRNVVEAARRAGVKRFVQMSALGASENGVSRYQTSKWQGEEAVRNSGIPFVILRPSLIFGAGDGFVTQMIDVMRTAPLMRPVVGTGKYPFRPIYIDDVVSCFLRALTSDAATNQTIDLGGGEELTLEQVLAEIASCISVRKPAVHVPFGVMYAGAAVLGRVLQRPPVTTDQLRMLRQGSTCDINPMQRILGVNPIGFRDGLQKYLCRPK